jgi:hypothetical protein
MYICITISATIKRCLCLERQMQKGNWIRMEVYSIGDAVKECIHMYRVD